LWLRAVTYELRTATHDLCAITYGHVLPHMGYVLSHMGHVLSHWVTCYHIWVFSRRCSVLKAYLGRRTACLGTSAHRPCFDLSVCLQPVCLSPDSQSDCLRFFSPPHPPLVDSLDSELWYHFGCRAAALASAAPRPLGSLSAAFHHAERAPRVTSSLTAESPTIRSFPTILGVDTSILATRVRRARKTRK
jgi:hypothetical protein